jgi:hypothetical protein
MGCAASPTFSGAIAFFCSQSCPGDVILKAQDWANARGPEGPTVVGGFHTPVERDVLRILLRARSPILLVLGRSLTGWRAPVVLPRKVGEFSKNAKNCNALSLGL